MDNTSIDILDVRGHALLDDHCKSLRHQILRGLSQRAGLKTLPTMLLYDELGLRLYDAITTDAEEYYLFHAEEEILRNYSKAIVRYMHAGLGGDCLDHEMIVELGAGALRKTSHILRALAGLARTSRDTHPITYYALDLEKRELERTLRELACSEVGQEIKGKIVTKGLCATYDDGLEFIQNGGLQGHSSMERITSHLHENYGLWKIARDASTSSSSSGYTENTPSSTPGSERPPLHLVFLGSSLGNFSREESVAFLKKLPLQPGTGSTLLLGLDHNNGCEKIEAAYNDSKGVTRAFIMNGLRVAGRTLGDESIFKPENWQYVGKYRQDSRRHEAYYKSKISQSITEPEQRIKFEFQEGELVRVEYSHKYSDEEAYALFSEAELRPVHRWMDNASQYSLWLLERPQFMFPLLSQPSPIAKLYNLPSISDWQDMWAVSDFVHKQIIPPSVLLRRPTSSRDYNLFSQAHVPAFLDLHISRFLQEHRAEQDLKNNLENLVGTKVDSLLLCHMDCSQRVGLDAFEVELLAYEHRFLASQAVLDWTSIDAFRRRVQQRVLRLYDGVSSSRVTLTYKIATVLNAALLYEALHVEMLLCMLLQHEKANISLPVGFVRPEWELLRKAWHTAPKPQASTVTLGPAHIIIDHINDVDDDDNPRTEDHLSNMEGERPKKRIAVDPFRIDWRPISNRQFYLFFLQKRADGITVPTNWIEISKDEFQIRTLYGPVTMEVAWDWPVITTYGNLLAYARAQGGRLPSEPELRLFYETYDCGYRGGANIGFRNWHPVPATTGLPRNGGRGHNGGVWEWTSTTFSKHNRSTPSESWSGYMAPCSSLPAADPRCTLNYSTDFFDIDHQVVIGGSYVTMPRLAENTARRIHSSRKYPSVWIGGRVVYDVV